MRIIEFGTIRFKWWYCAIVGFATIIDGLTMLLTLGLITTNLAMKYCLYGASRKIYKKDK